MRSLSRNSLAQRNSRKQRLLWPKRTAQSTKLRRTVSSKRTPHPARKLAFRNSPKKVNKQNPPHNGGFCYTKPMLYEFYGLECPHCQRMRELTDKLMQEYPHLKISR